MAQIIKGNFDEWGFPFLDLEVLNKKQGLCTKAKAIIDTGAAHCLIREELATQLQLEELRVADYLHPIFGKMPIKEFVMDVCFEANSQQGGPVVEGIRAGTLVDPNYPAAVIIGVEVLRHCKFEYDGQSKAFQLYLP